jgi:hypothetical protein
MNWQVQLIKKIFDAIFAAKAVNMDATAIQVVDPHIVGGVARGRWFKNGMLRGVDCDVNLGTRIVSLRFIEQNPQKSSQYAAMAVRGAKIMWVIDTRTQNGFLGRMQDGQWYPSTMRATTPAPPPVQNQAMAASASPMPDDTIDIPEIPAGMGIPDFVLNSFAEDNGINDDDLEFYGQ